MNSTDIEYVLHCIKNASELINQSESEKAKGLLLSAELLLSEKLTSDNSDYAKCKIEAEIKRLEENPEGDYVTRISALEWALRIFSERCTR